jgi:anthranilate phosphoribosyltransferase
LPAGTADGLAGGTPADNARIIEAVLSGKERGVARSAVILNAAAAIYVADAAPDMPAAAKLAAATIDSGKATAALDRLRSASAKR